MNGFDWERHFRAMKKPTAPSRTHFQFGTVLGEHTIAELQDLIAAKQVEIDRVDAAYHKILALGPPVPAVVAWKADWDTLQTRWAAAKADAQQAQAIYNANPLIPNNMAPAEGQYREVIKALAQAYPELHTQPGDLVDLAQRLSALGGEIESGPVPQPRPNSDVDFMALQGTNAVAQAAQHAIQAVTPSKSTMFLLAVGLGLGLFLLPKLLIPAPVRMFVR